MATLHTSELILYTLLNWTIRQACNPLTIAKNNLSRLFKVIREELTLLRWATIIGHVTLAMAMFSKSLKRVHSIVLEV